MARISYPEGADDTLDDALLRMLEKVSRRLPLPIFLAAALIAWLASHPHWPRPAVLVWVTAVAALLVLRRWALARLPAMGTIPARRRLQWAAMLNGGNGVAHSAGLLFFSHDAALPLSIASLLLVGLCAGSVATTSGSRPLFLAYCIPVMGALVLHWLLMAAAPGPHPFALAIALILALFAA
ncbi:MAG: hypothetical protein WKG03_01300, partial [Telluria sp.]